MKPERDSSDALQVELERWKLRTLDAERRYREREVALRRLRREIEDLRSDRDAWRQQAERLAQGAAPEAEPAGRGDAALKARMIAGRTLRAAWEAVPEPGRRLARPLIRRVRTRGTVALPAPGTDGPPALPAAPAEELSVQNRQGPDAIPAAAQVVTERVSIVIPTLNGGPLFARTLDGIRAQQGVGDVELLVVDSGSADGTAELARSRGATVVEIPGASFSHGGTRDRMAAMATGDVMVMMVQDAALAGPWALRDLVVELTADPHLAAVSARQIPRVDCDLFAAFLLFAHARSTLAGVRGDDAGWFPMLTASERRAACVVDNVCAAIRRSAWDTLRFRDVAFGEDLDFGLRAVEQGWRVALARQATVVHSHSRDAVYHLSRFVVDRMALATLLGDPEANPVAEKGLEAVAAGAAALLGEVEAARRSASDGRGPVPFGPYLDAVAVALAERRPGTRPRGELASIGTLLGDFDEPPDAAVVEALRGVLDTLLGAPILKEFAQVHPWVGRSEAEAFVARAAALAVGQVLGESMRDRIADTPLAARLLAGV
jgi:GT2 family glycosyltransferase